MRRFIAKILSISLGLLVLSGCASKYGEPRTQPQYYPGCYRPIQDLRDREHSVGKSTAVGAGIGAASGALIGLLTTGKWQGALMGAAVGGVGGTMVGNMYGRKQQMRDDNIRLNSYLQDLDGDISNLDVTGAAARTALQCYDRQFQGLLSAIRARQISREAAAARFREIQDGREEAIAILGNAAAYGENLSQQYEHAFVSEQQQIQTPQKVSQNRAQYQRNAATLNAAKKRKQTLAHRTAAIRQERSVAQNTTSQQMQEINQAMAELQEIHS